MLWSHHPSPAWHRCDIARARLLIAILLATAPIAEACRKAETIPADLALDDGRQWLDAAAPPPSSPVLLRAAVASAFNQTQVAERLLEEIVQRRPGSDSARKARMLLSRIYLRSGRYQQLIANLDAWARSFPGDSDLTKEKADMEKFRGLPDQRSGPRSPSTLPHGPANDFAAPASINGKPVAYLLDTGAWMSVMNEAEVKRLGLTILSTEGMLGDASGQVVKVRIAVAHDVMLGSISFQDVSFAILPDVEPWRSMEVGRGGILGIPVLLDVACLRWTRGGNWELGCPLQVAGDSRASRASSNLVFFQNHLLLATSTGGTRVFGNLDTGAETTDLNANFATQFAEAIKQKGTKDSTSIAGVAGSVSIESVTLPDVHFDIGDTPVTLRPAHVTLQKNAAMGGRCCIGNVGLDLLLQTGALTIDFTTMTLRLR